MTEPASPFETTPIEPDDLNAGFSCGKHPLDDYFARHALPNDRAGIGRAYVLRRTEASDAGLPNVLGLCTLSMAHVESTAIADALARKLPKYPMPVALIGRLAVDTRAHGRRLGETLLLDALRRVLEACSILGCLGVIVDAKDDDALRFYAKYDFVAFAGEGWPRRMFLPIHTVRQAFVPPTPPATSS